MTSVTATGLEAGPTILRPASAGQTVATGAGKSAGGLESFREGIENRDARAAEVFRAELSRAVASDLKVRIKAGQSPYGGSLDDTVSDTLRTTGRLVADNPDIGTRVVARVRQSVAAAARIVSQSVAVGDDTSAVDNSVRDIGKGLDSIGETAARQVESTASVLSADTLVRQRSAIRIRTQEGDVVRLVVNFRQRTSVEDVAVQGDGFAYRGTEIAVAERSRLSLKVKGDLNDAELSAIKSVLAQAESVAEEFFGGDVGAALSAATNLSFDESQLARVNLRLRSRSVSNLAFAQTTVRQPAIETPQENTPLAQPVRAAAPSAVETRSAPPIAAPRPAPVSTPEPAETAAPAIEAPAVEQPAAEQPAPEPASDPVGGFFDLLSDFLRGVSQGFELSSNSTFTFNYSQSFKLQVLKSVFELVSPTDGDDDSAANQLIDAAIAADTTDDTDD